MMRALDQTRYHVKVEFSFNFGDDNQIPVALLMVQNVLERLTEANKDGNLVITRMEGEIERWATK